MGTGEAALVEKVRGLTVPKPGSAVSPPLDSSELSLAATGITQDNLLQLAQAVAAKVGLGFTFESGSNVTFQIYMPGTVMVEQTSTHKAQTGDITSSTVGSIGSARDVTVFQNQVENSSIAADAKKALLEARQKLETLNLSSKSKSDVAGDLDKVAQELTESQPDEGRLKRLLRNIRELSPPISAVLSMAASLHKLMT